jgi:hypothetical protein
MFGLRAGERSIETFVTHTACSMSLIQPNGVSLIQPTHVRGHISLCCEVATVCLHAVIIWRVRLVGDQMLAIDSSLEEQPLSQTFWDVRYSASPGPKTAWASHSRYASCLPPYAL